MRARKVRAILVFMAVNAILDAAVSLAIYWGINR